MDDEEGQFWQQVDSDERRRYFDKLLGDDPAYENWMKQLEEYEHEISRERWSRL